MMGDVIASRFDGKPLLLDEKVGDEKFPQSPFILELPIRPAARRVCRLNFRLR